MYKVATDLTAARDREKVVAGVEGLESTAPTCLAVCRQRREGACIPRLDGRKMDDWRLSQPQ